MAKEGSQLRPEQLTGLADTLADYLNPDGTFTDGDRARRRGLTLGNQQADGTSQLRGWLTPEARATLEAVWAKLAAPGMCNPTDDTPCVDGTPSQETIDGDARSAPQRNHDALLAALRSLLASGKLCQHNGLPASIIVTTTLGELEAAAGKGLTGGGTTLPISDVIRLARHAHHYLAIFDKGNALALYHTKRLASPGQRIMLRAKECAGCALVANWLARALIVPQGVSRPGSLIDPGGRREIDLTWAIGRFCEAHHGCDLSERNAFRVQGGVDVPGNRVWRPMIQAVDADCVRNPDDVGVVPRWPSEA